MGIKTLGEKSYWPYLNWYIVAFTPSSLVRGEMVACLLFVEILDSLQIFLRIARVD